MSYDNNIEVGGEMKKILLSFKPFWYEKISTGEKIFEYRKRFCDEAVLAYMYVSRPVMAVTGIVLLDHRIPLQSWMDKYKYDRDVYVRIKDSMSRNSYAMSILEYIPTNALTLKTIQENVPGFIAPQMYYNLLPGTALCEYLEKNIHNTGEKIVNNFEGNIKEEICKKMT